MALIKCNECGKEISDKSTKCIYCGCPIEKELLCNECGNKLDKNDKTCKCCGCPIKSKSNFFKEKLSKYQNNIKEKNIKTTDTKDKKNKMIIKIVLGLVIGFIAIIIVIFAMGGFKEKIDVRGTSMLEYLTILEDYGRDIDFNGITSGANCYTGKQTKTVNSDKYGKVIIEFSYCKSSNSVYIHVYN